MTAAPATAAPATIAPSCAEELDAAEEALAHADTNETKTKETSTRSKNASFPPPIAFALLDRLRCVDPLGAPPPPPKNKCCNLTLQNRRMLKGIPSSPDFCKTGEC